MKRVATGRFLLLLCVLLWLAPETLATERMALDSGHSCSYCHLDPAGGGVLTADGEAYITQLYGTGDGAGPNPAARFLRLVIGYLHILFAVLWFGTILYVHIVLKPSYAAQGLPRGEKLVGVISFWVVGITGLVLTQSRFSSWSQLFETRFGILLTIKVALYLLMMFSAILVIKVIGPRLSGKTVKAHVPGEPFTAGTLRAFDGKNGKPCYFAYQGKVYDASESRLWPSGEHMKRHAAGTDLTTDLGQAPHDDQVISRLPEVGQFAADRDGPADLSDRLFYAIAYMNLGIVFIILFILALWRWG